jgi:hypothetical protein
MVLLIEKIITLRLLVMVVSLAYLTLSFQILKEAFLCITVIIDLKIINYDIYYLMLTL